MLIDHIKTSLLDPGVWIGPFSLDLEFVVHGTIWYVVLNHDAGTICKSRMQQNFKLVQIFTFSLSLSPDI